MPSPVHQTHSPTNEGEIHRQLDRDIRDMVSSITHRVTDFHKSNPTHHSENEDDHGVSLITLVGTNNGATMKGELDEKTGNPSHFGEPETLSTFVNSNFQAINNSVMLGGSYQANDPGVHLDISDFLTENQKDHKEENVHGRKGKKKEREASKHKHHDSSHSVGDE